MMRPKGKARQRLKWAGCSFEFLFFLLQRLKNCGCYKDMDSLLLVNNSTTTTMMFSSIVTFISMEFYVIVRRISMVCHGTWYGNRSGLPPLSALSARALISVAYYLRSIQRGKFLPSCRYILGAYSQEHID